MLNDRISAWLVKTGNSRAQLAEMLNVSPRTVDGWLGAQKRPIPARMHAAIEEIVMPKADPGCVLLPLNIPDDIWKGLKEQMKIESDEEAKEIATQQLLAFIRAVQHPLK